MSTCGSFKSLTLNQDILIYNFGSHTDDLTISLTESINSRYKLYFKSFVLCGLQSQVSLVYKMKDENVLHVSITGNIQVSVKIFLFKHQNDFKDNASCCMPIFLFFTKSFNFILGNNVLKCQKPISIFFVCVCESRSSNVTQSRLKGSKLKITRGFCKSQGTASVGFSISLHFAFSFCVYM